MCYIIFYILLSMEKIKLTVVSLTLNEEGGGKRDILIKFKR